MKRIFLIVLDSVGIGGAPDAAAYGDEGSDTLAAAAQSPFFDTPNLQRLGLFNIPNITCRSGAQRPLAAFARMCESSNGKDSTIGHWEIAGIHSEKPLPVYPNGFPQDLLDEFSRRTGRGVLCNRPYSGTQVIRDYGQEMAKTGALIVYTSADSVFQIAAHESVVPIHELYRCCEIARELLAGEHSVGRVIARPFAGEWPFVRTENRHDYSLVPPGLTMLDQLLQAGLDVISVGKINDLFAGRGVTRAVHTGNNGEGIARTLELASQDFHGLCFTNLVDFDTVYGHRNDADGYAKALTKFDACLPELCARMGRDDLLMITADHGCDPATPSTDHSRECTPWLIYGPRVQAGKNLGTLPTFSDIGATVLAAFGVSSKICGTSRLKDLLKGENTRWNGTP